MCDDFRDYMRCKSLLHAMQKADNPMNNQIYVVQTQSGDCSSQYFCLQFCKLYKAQGRAFKFEQANNRSDCSDACNTSVKMSMSTLIPLFLT